MPSIRLLFGPMLIGVFLNMILYGMLLVQTFTYYLTYKRDAKWIRYFILYILLAETVNTALDMWMMFEPLVLEYATPAATTFFPKMLAADPIATVLISAPIQVFIAWRIHIISRNKWIPILVVLLAATSIGGGIWLGVKVTIIKRYALKPELHHPALLWLVCSAVADVIITTALCWSLTKRKTGFNSTDDAINKIIRLTVQTGLITAIFACLDVICFLALPHTTLNFTWDFALSKLYSNALLSTLNARTRWNGALTTDNVLFGKDHSGGTGADHSGVVSMTSNKRLNLSNNGQLSNGVYELSATTPSSGGKVALDSFSHSPAVEYGMPVTGIKSVDSDFRAM